jgi:DEAD/DEAH box helicase domain-containing protein
MHAQRERAQIGRLFARVFTASFYDAVVQLDLPGLDACLMLSHPGSKMSFWQRVGRAGRSKPGM